MAKKDLVKYLASEHDLTQQLSWDIVESVLAYLNDRLVKGESVRLVGFGEFQVKSRASRSVIHPTSKKTMQIPAYKTVTFSPGKTILDEINKGVTA